MPKKTKKEKLLASYHKKLHLLESKQTPKQSNIGTAEASTFEPPKYFFSDLKKSLILIVAVLGIEILLYFAKLIK